jgi:hypothetical protein
MPESTNVLDARLLGENDWIAVTEVCRLCVMEMTAIVELVELGVVASKGSSPDQWMVPANSLPRLRVVGRLMRDLGVNVTGAALAIELLESRGELERRISRLERMVHD